jgi:hypothetical protein
MLKLKFEIIQLYKFLYLLIFIKIIILKKNFSLYKNL